MDDDLVLNIALDSGPAGGTSSKGKKGGRWTDRLKAKRTLKRKAPTEDGPRKKPRPEPTRVEPTRSEPAPRAPPRPAQIISSLFSFNPKVDHAPEKAAPAVQSAPSNAPIDSSTFSGLGLNSLLITHLTSKMNISKPTAIQRAALPVLLSPSPDTISRDIFLQSQTGSGKTLSYLLPIIQDLLPLSSLSYIDRSIGTLAVIIAPTRELAKQISDVLEALLKLRLRPEDESSTEPDTSTRLTRWLVSGLLIGGATRTHEKARLRKGLPILVSTPGRMLDHLQNTSSFNVGKCRWLILDEADQLMELGFEETIKGILQGLDGRRRLAQQAMAEGKSTEVGDWDWERRRRTILCSATIRENVQKLAGTALINTLMIKATEGDKEEEENRDGGTASQTFTPPSQLSQKYIVAPLKLRLVTLVALLRTLISQSRSRTGTKIIVFLSCTDSVDFHWNLLGGATMDQESQELKSTSDDGDDSGSESGGNAHLPNQDRVGTKCPLLPGVQIYRLHGSLLTSARQAAIKGFSGSSSKGKEASTSILLCTSVASRGLDLPLVRAVIQYDLPTEGGATEYVHRVGRTARAGKGGEAWSFVAPSEAAWAKWVEGQMQGEKSEDTSGVALHPVNVENVLSSGFGGKGTEYEDRATEVQLAFEHWVLRNKEHASLAQKAYLSHMRAYATHPSTEKHIFHIRNLHIGHLAKAFALRDAPKAVKVQANAPKEKKSQPRRRQRQEHGEDVDKAEDEDWAKHHSGEAEKRMQAVVRAQGRLTKKGGAMVSTGASEFQVSSTAELEKLLRR